MTGVRASQATRADGGPQAALEEVLPFLLAVPAFWQVQGEVPAAMTGRAGGDVDQVPTQRGAAGPGAGEAGQIRPHAAGCG